jgi:predicted outer membrane protein
MSSLWGAPHARRGLASALVISAASVVCVACASSHAPHAQPPSTTRVTSARVAAPSPVYEGAPTRAEASPSRATSRERAATADTAEKMTDARILAVLDAASLAQMERAHLADKQAKTNDVRVFAQSVAVSAERAKDEQRRMEREHQIAPKPSDVSRHIQSDNLGTMNALRAETTTAFDHAYLRDEADAQSALRLLIDAELTPNVHSDALKRYLAQTRKEVELHRWRARRLLGEKD